MSENETEANPRAVAGANNPPVWELLRSLSKEEDLARIITDFLKDEYRRFELSVDVKLEAARGQPKEVTDDETATTMGLIVKELRELDREAEAYRVKEKDPPKSWADAVDAYLFAIRERLARRNPRDRTQRPGAADVLQARIDDYLERKRLAAAARLQQEQEETKRIADATAKKAEEERVAAEQARLAAERARTPETTAAKEAIADVKQEQASTSAIEATIAQEKADAAHIATLAKPAELSRTRGDGVLLTETRVPYAFVTDRALLDKNALWTFFTDAEIEKALRGWAKTTGHRTPMAGAEVGHRQKGVTR